MTNTTTFDYTSAVKRVTDREVAAARLASDYAALVLHFGLTHDTDSKVLTEVSRTVVVDGAHALDNSETARTLTADMLKGSDPGADAAHRIYWKAARAVRAGLVYALGDKEKATADATLRVSLSGEGGGSSTVPMDSDLGRAILKFLADDNTCLNAETDGCDTPAYAGGYCPSCIHALSESADQS